MAEKKHADFSGWATKANLTCSDGRTITPDAFRHMDGQTVPLVWQHQHDDPSNILGYAVLEHREGEGVYTYGYFNDTEAGQEAKKLVQHGDVTWLSIFANQLVEKSKSVLHGAIREVSLVLAGANPGARIENIALAHSDGTIVTAEDEAIITSGETIEHAAAPADQKAADGGETVQDIYDSLSEKQKNVVNYLIGEAISGNDNAQHSDTDGDPAETIEHSQEDTIMTRNAFEQNGLTLQHSERPRLTREQLETIVNDAKKMGSFKESFLAHAADYGITNIEMLFPDAKTIDNAPELIARRQEWVQKVLGGARKSPFSRIKSRSADITHDEARAKGYIKGNLKKEEFFSLQQRITTPTTVYKKQKLDRDDIIDITDLDIVAWLKGEMRLMLDEELARAALVGDGREVDNEDKIKEPTGNEGAGIRSIAYDDEFYAHRVTVATNVSGDALVEAIVRARPKYRGSGNPTMFTTEDILTDMLLVKDRMGRRLYQTQAELESALRVSEIVPVPVMEDQKVGDDDLLAILVNMNDYTFGADRGGEVSMFDDFDIDYNQYKYLMETRVSGALTKFKTALVVVRDGGGTEVTPAVPTFVPASGIVTIPNTAGVVYKNAETGSTLTAGAQNAIAAGATISVEAVPATGYYFPHNFDADWDFTRPLA